MKSISFALALIMTLYSAPGNAEECSLKIRIKVGDKTLAATLIASKTTRDFISMLQL